jgi:hypothetical protein
MIDEIERISKIKKERNMNNKIGKARYGGSTQRKYFKLKDGDQAYRILPPLGELAESGRWSVFHSVHYGYKTTDGKQKPFLSPEVKNRKNNTVEVEDAAKNRIETLKLELEKAKKSGNKAAFEKLNELVGPTGMYNLDNNHYMNVVDAQGNIGILKLRHRAKLALEAQIKDLVAQGIDPLSPEDGRYFIFTRSGMGRDTTFAVKVLKEKLNVQGVGLVEKDVVHKLNDEICGRFGTEAGELNKLFKRLPAEEVAKVVETSDLMTGVSSYLDELFGKTKAAEPAVEEGYEDGPEPEETSVQAAAPVASTPTATLTTVATTKVTPIAPVQSKMTSVTELSNDEFLRKLNEGTL